MKGLKDVIQITPRPHRSIPVIRPEDISLVMPVRNNQLGVDRFVKELLVKTPPPFLPREFIIVDNNSREKLELPKLPGGTKLPLQLLFCDKPGPAAARNHGVKHSKANWILFSDSDCVPTESFIRGYINNAPKAIAYAGAIKGTPRGSLTDYYDSERILLPYFGKGTHSTSVPLYVVTANALVLRKAFRECGEFSESFHYAAGEDVDLGTRLWQYGSIEFASESLILHDFADGISGFCRRFVRYGRGNLHMERTRGIRMRPYLRLPNRRSFTHVLAKFLQHLCLSLGYYGEMLINRRQLIDSGSADHLHAMHESYIRSN